MKIARTSSTLGIVRSRPRSRRDFEITTIQTIKDYISALANVRKLCLCMSVNHIIKYKIINIVTLE